jgi:hypothetical protein
VNFHEVEFRRNELIRLRRLHRKNNPTWTPLDDTIAGARIELAMRQMRRLASAAGLQVTRRGIVPMPTRTDWTRTIPGMPVPRASVQTDEQPFPLCRVKHLPPPPSAPRESAALDPSSLFSRALTWTLKQSR